MDVTFIYHHDDWSDRTDFRHLMCAKDNLGDWFDLEALYYSDYMKLTKRWLEENIGILGIDWTISRHNSTYYFKYKEDAMAFKLRWM